MGSGRWVLVLFHIFLHLFVIGLTIAQPRLLGYRCPDTVNYTQDSAYRNNLDNLLYTLSTKTTSFSNFSSGQTPDVANGIALCRGDVDPDTCHRCVDDSTRRLKQLCPNQKEAIGYYELCTVRYSNRFIFGIMETAPGYPVANTTGAPNVVQFNQTVVSLLVKLNDEAARSGGSTRKFATGKTVGPDNLTIYGLVQCTPDISGPQCSSCLDKAMERYPSTCDGKIGCRILSPSCNFRYEIGAFYNETPADAPPPAAPPPATPPTLHAVLKKVRKKNATWIVPVTASTLTATVVAIMVLLIYRRSSRNKKQKALCSMDSLEEYKLQMDQNDSGEMHYFMLTTIQAATNGFSTENKLGEGGFGPVYRGKLDDGKEIAVKRLSKNSGQGLDEFKTEVRLIVKLQHKNLVRLLGCCVEGDEKLLVYEYMANTSLDAFLFDPIKCRELNWPKRANIVDGIAKGLRYLHEDSRLRTIHRDMKSSNVLLDEEMNAKISDFGTARIFGSSQVEANTNRVVGTYGYMAPEYAMEGLFSTKSDVYSFGVMMLEIITGKRNRGFYGAEHVENLVSCAWRVWKEGKGQLLIDQNLVESCPLTEALRWINIALLCVQENPTDRPAMSTVVFMLGGQLTSLPQPSEPPFSVGRLDIFEQFSTTGEGTAFFPSDQDSTSASLY